MPDTRRGAGHPDGGDLLCAMDLWGVRAKVDRARGGLKNVETGIETRCADEKRRLELDILRNAFSSRDAEEPQILYGYSVMVGEVAYNLRSSLDHLVWQLVRANGCDPKRSNEFPVFWDEDRYRKKVGTKLRGVAKRHRQMIEDVQPFRPESFVGPHLRMLHDICNTDKHRHLNVVDIHSIASAYPDGEIPPGSLPRGMTKGLGLYSYLEKHQVKPHAVVDVCFMDPELEEVSPGYGSAIETAGTMRRPPVIPVLQYCLDAVSDVIEQLTGESVRTSGSWSSGTPTGGDDEVAAAGS